jgi:uncharacterized membrane protein HdeD (DUF308 family)
MAISSDLGRGPLALAILPPLARNWWVFLVRGLVAIAFGLVGFFYPAATLVAFILVYGVFALLDGVFAVIAAARGKGGMGPRWWLALVGILGIVAGLVTFAWPGITALVMLAVIGVWALLYGIAEIIGAIRLRKEIENEWLLLLHGALAVLFGLSVLVRPGAGALALVWLIAAFALASGVVLVMFAFALRKHAAKV